MGYICFRPVCLFLWISLFVSDGHFLSAGNEVNSDAPKQTVITSNSLEMVRKEDANYFHFQGRVRVESENLRLHCDKLEVITVNSQEGGEDKNAQEVNSTRFGRIEKITAKGSVVIEQQGRTADADSAIVHPQKEFMILEGNVKLRNEDGVVSGPRLLIEKGKRAVIKGEKEDSENQRAKVRLFQSLPDLGKNSDPKESDNEKKSGGDEEDSKTDDKEGKNEGWK